MARTRTTALVGAVLVLALVQVAYEEVLVFLGATGQLPATSPLLLVAVPLAVSLALAVLLIGGAILHADTLR